MFCSRLEKNSKSLLSTSYIPSLHSWIIEDIPRMYYIMYCHFFCHSSLEQVFNALIWAMENRCRLSFILKFLIVTEKCKKFLNVEIYEVVKSSRVKCFLRLKVSPSDPSFLIFTDEIFTTQKQSPRGVL